MRRSLLAGIGALAVFIFAACSTDQPSRGPLAPAEVGLAKGGGGGSPLCSGNLASDIAKEQDLLFTNATDLDEMQDQFALIKTACPIVETDASELALLLGYFELMISNRTAENETGLAGHLFSVSRYATGTGLVRSSSVFSSTGGADVLTVTETAGDALVTFDKGVRLLFDEGTEAITTAGNVPFGSRFFTFEPLTSEECGDITGLRPSTRGAGASCFDVQDYPDAIGYTPEATLTICMHKSADENDGIVHEKNGFGDEVLPPVEDAPFFDCADFHSGPSTTWLERNGGPLGRILARAYDYFAPKTLIADDAGESGSLGFFSKVGGVLTDIFEDDFNDPDSFNPNPAADSPDLADDGATWIYTAQSPGFIRIQDALGDLTGGVLVLSQGQGACNNCPVFRLLGEIRTVDETIAGQNETDYETNGSFDVIFTSLQNKPSIKEAPFILLNGGTGTEAAREIVRLSYVTQMNQNRLLLKVPGNGNAVNTIPVGNWVQNVSQTFKITVNLNVLNDTYDKTVSLAIWNPASLLEDKFEPVAGAQNIPASRATSFKHIGYILTGIDAGVIASDNWRVTRLPDIPPP